MVLVDFNGQGGPIGTASAAPAGSFPFWECHIADYYTGNLAAPVLLPATGPRVGRRADPCANLRESG